MLYLVLGRVDAVDGSRWSVHDPHLHPKWNRQQWLSPRYLSPSYFRHRAHPSNKNTVYTGLLILICWLYINMLSKEESTTWEQAFPTIRINMRRSGGNQMAQNNRANRRSRVALACDICRLRKSRVNIYPPLPLHCTVNWHFLSAMAFAPAALRVVVWGLSVYIPPQTIPRMSSFRKSSYH